jgi:glycine/D-amino acid oxidase-like deaminating enzyme
MFFDFSFLLKSEAFLTDKRRQNMESFRNKSFWLEGAYEGYAPNAPLEGDKRYDFVIAGGGFTGLSAAYFLKERAPDMKIAILESQVVGYGASGRNDGFNMTLLGENIIELARLVGEEKARAGHEWAKEAVETVRGLVEKHNIACDYEHNGFLLIGLSKPHVAKLKKEAELHRKLGTDAKYLTAADARKLLPSTPVCAGMLEPHCGILNPAKYCRGMKRIVEEMGVDIYENTRVVKIEEGKTVRMHTARGCVSAPAAMPATNAYSGKLGYFRSHVFPLFTYIVLTEPLTDKQLSNIGWEGRWGIETANRFVHYFRLTPDNRISIGGGTAKYYFNFGTTRDAHPKIFNQIETALVSLFPPLKGIKITHRWGGPVACTFDFFPVAGVMGKYNNIYYSTGYTGHGVSLANASGKIIRDLYFREETHRTKLFFINRRPFPFPPEPLLYPAIHAYTGYLSLRDSIDNLQPGCPPENK